MTIYSNTLDDIVNKIRAIREAEGDEDDDVSAGESDNFMDDDSDDDVADGESDNFMDDNEGGDDTSSDTTETEDDVAAGESDNFMDDNGDDSDGDVGGEEDGSSDDVADGESDNFIDDSDGGEDGDTEGTEEGEGETTEGEEDQSEEEGQEGEELDIDKIEDELFSSLTPEQIAIKNHELKNQFIKIYTTIGSTLVRINDIPKSNDNIDVLKFVTEKLLELREMVDYNVTVAYSTRTYIENNIIYQQCIATLNMISDIIKNITNINGEESAINQSEENDKEDLGEPVEPDDNEEQHQLDISDTSVSDYQEESYKYDNSYDVDINVLF